MRTLVMLALVGMSLAGCASHRAPPVYGNFVQGAAPADSKMMADDVARKLVSLYPPARMRIRLGLATPDHFGAMLVAALRTSGYAVAEFKPGASTGSPGQESDVALAYLVDQPLEAGLYRVTVLVNSQSLSRLYQATDGTIAPAAYWVRKE